MDKALKFAQAFAVAGFDGLNVGVDTDTFDVTFGDDVSEADRARVRAFVASYDPNAIDMPALRRSAFNAAMAYGNGITAKVTSAYADVEVQSWTAQEAEARTVLAGGTLIEHALLPPLAEDKGVSLEAYAESVIEKADAYRQIAIAAVRLRRGAEGLLSEQLDTPEKLDAAVEALRAQTMAAAAALGIEV